MKYLLFVVFALPALTQVTTGTLNPQACWDWWGYTGREYLTRKGPQVVAVRRMLDRLAGR